MTGICRLICAHCGETIGWEVPFSEVVEADVDYPVRLLDINCVPPSGTGIHRVM